MRSIQSFIVGCVLLWPGTAGAQSPVAKRDDLVGTWRGTFVSRDGGYEMKYDSAGKVVARTKAPVEYLLTLRADSTWEQKRVNTPETDLGPDYHGWEGGSAKTGMLWSMPNGDLWGYCPVVSGDELKFYPRDGSARKENEMCSSTRVTSGRPEWVFKRVPPSP